MRAKKLIALLLAFVLCTGILAACQTQPVETTASTKGTSSTTAPTSGSVTEEYTRPNLEGAKITCYYASTTVEDGECYLDRVVSELLNMDWDIQLPGNNWNEIVTPLMAEGKVPDISGRNSYGNTEIQYGEDGAYINIYDYLDQMPNVKAYLEDPQYAESIEKYTVREGVMYCLPIEREIDTNIWAYLYRDDIFTKHNLSWPTNQEEFYNTLVKLKELYPNSYPLVIRPQSTDQVGLINWGITWGATWGTNNKPLKLDENKEYYFGLISDEMKEMAAFLKKLLDEGLLHPSYSTISSTEWNECLANGTSFITYDKVTKILDVEPVAKELDPNFSMTSGIVFPMGSNGVAATSAAGNAAAVSYAIGNNDNLENTLKFVDWLYSPEGIEITNWGIEGESYEVDSNGNKQYKQEFLDKYDVFTHSGLGLHFPSAHTTWDAYAARTDAGLIEAMERGMPFKFLAPRQYDVVYNDEELQVIDAYATAMYEYALGEYMKFCLGQRDLAEWDEYVKTVEEKYHLAEIKAANESALERALAE